MHGYLTPANSDREMNRARITRRPAESTRARNDIPGLPRFLQRAADDKPAVDPSPTAEREARSVAATVAANLPPTGRATGSAVGPATAAGSTFSLPAGIRAPMENAFGADFSGVHVHADGESERLNRSVHARAFTTGDDIYFRPQEYRPHEDSGRQLLAHELTHVVQQRAAPPWTPAIQRQVDGGVPEAGPRDAGENDRSRVPVPASAKPDPAAMANVERQLPAAIEVLRGLAGAGTFADWIVPLLTPMAESVGHRSASGAEVGGADLTVTFPGTPTRYAIRLVLDDSADPKVDGMFTTVEGSTRGRIVLFAQRLGDKSPAEIAEVLYHEFLHLFSAWFRQRGIGAARLPEVSEAVAAHIGVRTHYAAEITLVNGHVRAIAGEIARARRTAGRPPFTGDSSAFGASLVEEAVVYAETDFMSMMKTNLAGRSPMAATTVDVDDRLASRTGEEIAHKYLFETGQMFEKTDAGVVTDSVAARKAEEGIRRTLGGVSLDHLTLRAGTERAIGAR